MKKNFKKLVLNKSTLSNLEDNQIIGGQDLKITGNSVCNICTENSLKVCQSNLKFCQTNKPGCYTNNVGCPNPLTFIKC